MNKCFVGWNLSWYYTFYFRNGFKLIFSSYYWKFNSLLGKPHDFSLLPLVAFWDFASFIFLTCFTARLKQHISWDKMCIIGNGAQVALCLEWISPYSVFAAPAPWRKLGWLTIKAVTVGIRASYNLRNWNCVSVCQVSSLSLLPNVAPFSWDSPRNFRAYACQ